jgi:hypothetical protein
MPGIVRILDKHVGHAGVLVPFHQTFFNKGSPTVFANERKVVRKGDTCVCGDAAAAHSATVFANNIPVHRIGDATTGHGAWVPNSAQTGSANVIVGS